MRALWGGSLSFGLINIPVRLYSASADRALKFRLLDKTDNCPISYARICRAKNREVPYQDIIKAFEWKKDHYVIVEPQDFASAAPRKTKTIDIVKFIDTNTVPLSHVVRPYYIEPEEEAHKAYALLRDALKKSGKSGLATVVLRDKEHITVIEPQDQALMLISLRFEDELRKPEDIILPKSVAYKPQELQMAESLIEQLTGRYDPHEFKDTYTEELKKLINRKAKGKPVRIKEFEGTPTSTDMNDLMSALRKSLSQEKNKKKKEKVR
ncbi:Ku protein [Candidatus Parcubacteria bacterium]|nr:Ku protein [Candidatus Parcubacteria bacterium]